MAASDKKLGALHEYVAEALSEQVQGYDEETTGAEGEITVKRIRPGAAVLGAAIAFLKNNNVTADPEDNLALRDLSEKLKARRNKKLPQAELDAAAEEFANRYGSEHRVQ